MHNMWVWPAKHWVWTTWVEIGEIRGCHNRLKPSISDSKQFVSGSNHDHVKHDDHWDDCLFCLPKTWGFKNGEMWLARDGGFSSKTISLALVALAQTWAGRTSGEVEPWSTGGLKQQQGPNLERLCFLLKMYDYVICLYVNVTMYIFVLVPVQLLRTTQENQGKHGLNLQQWVQNLHQRSNLWRQLGASQKWSCHKIP